MIAVGDRVRVVADGDYVRVGVEWWPGRIGYVERADAREALVRWVGGGQSKLPSYRVKVEMPLPCGSCGRPVYRGFGCMTGNEMEFVPDLRGALALVAGRGIDRNLPQAAAQERLRRGKIGSNDPLAGMTPHWRVCTAAPKYLAVSSGHDSRRAPARDDAAGPVVGRAPAD